MPNWCHNKLRIMGNAKQLDEFINAVKTDEQPLSFESLCPTPVELIDGEGWYHWRVGGFNDLTNEYYGWGTKWDAHFPGETKKEVQQAQLGDMFEAFYEFETAWSPPSNFLVQASSLYPELKFTLDYAETGMVFAGKLILQDGKILDDIELSVKDVIGKGENWF